MTKTATTSTNTLSQRQAIEALQKSQERLELALKVSRLGMWEFNVDTGELWWSDEIRKIYGVGPKRHITYDLYQSLIHPQDRPHMLEVISKSMQDGQPYEAEHRIVRPDGQVHWVYSRGQAFLNGGKPVRMTGTCLNIDDRKAAEALKVRNALLDAERKELVRLNKSKDDFIALASHQLRTPATSVKQYIGMLLEGFVGELRLTKQQLKLLRTAYDSNQRQIEIVNDLLLIATIDAGKIKLQKQPTDVNAFLREINDDYQPKYSKRHQNLVPQIPDETIFANFDEIRLRMAIENLLDNASKYSAENTSVMLSLASEGGNISISIADHGVGISKEDHAKLFQKFSRIPNELSTSSGGSGLGLYWAHKIIKLHDGTLNVVSKPGQGSTFTITLQR